MVKLDAVSLVAYFVLLAPIVVIQFGEKSIGLIDLCLIPMILWLLCQRQIVVDSTAVVFSTIAVIAVLSSMKVGLDSGWELSLILVIRIVELAALSIFMAQTQQASLAGKKRIIEYFLLGAFLSILAGIILHSAGISIKDSQQRLWHSEGSTARAGGLTGNTAGFGLMTALWFGVASYYATVYLSKLRELFLFSAAIVSLYAILISSSRAALMNFTIVFICGIVSSFTGLGAVSIVGFSVLIVAVLLFLGSNEVTIWDSSFLDVSLDRLNVFSLFGSKESEFLQTVRFDNWRTALEHLTQKPFLGHGYKQFSESTGIYTDNSYLGVFIDFGILAGVLFLLFWFLLLIRSISMVNRHGLKHLPAVGFVVGNAVHSLTVDTYSIWYAMPIFLVFSYLFTDSTKPSIGLENEYIIPHIAS